MGFPQPPAPLNLLSPAPYDFLTYYSHISLGLIGVLAALIALWTLKGGRAHRWAGRIYLVGVGIAAGTALITLFTNFLAPTIINAAIFLYAGGTAYIATYRPSDRIRRVEWMVFAMGALVTLWFIMVAGANVANGTVPLLAPVGVGGILAILLLGDLNYLLRSNAYRASHRIRRHLARISWALLVSVRAPVNELRDVIGLSQAQVVFLPYLIFLAMILVFWRTAKRMERRVPIRKHAP